MAHWRGICAKCNDADFASCYHCKQPVCEAHLDVDRHKCIQELQTKNDLQITESMKLKKYCHIPGNENEPDLDLFQNEYFREQQICGHWETGNFSVRKFDPDIQIKSSKVVIDSFGRNLLFLSDGAKVKIWDIQNRPSLHFSFKIIHWKDRLPKMEFRLYNGRLFVIRGTLIEVFKFEEPKFKPIALYKLIGDEKWEAENHIFDHGGWFKNNEAKIDSAEVYVIEKYILVHKYFESCTPQLKIYDLETGCKLKEIDWDLSITSNSRVFFQSKLSLEQDKILVKAHVRRFNNSYKVHIGVICVKTLQIEVLSTYSDEVTFFNWVSKSKILVCLQLQAHKELKFEVFEKEDCEWNKAFHFIEPFPVCVYSHDERLMRIDFKFHIFQSKLIIARDFCNTTIIDLDTTDLEVTIIKCVVPDVKYLWFVNPKFFILIRENKRGEIWDIEANKCVARIKASGSTLRCASWQNMMTAPPKYIIIENNNVLIFDFQ